MNWLHRSRQPCEHEWMRILPVLLLLLAPTFNLRGQKTPPAGGQHKSGGSLLDQMSQMEKESAAHHSPVLTARQLEQQFGELSKTRDRVAELKQQVQEELAVGSDQANVHAMEGQKILAGLNQQLVTLEQNLAAARKARPQDLTVQWLTGELLMLVGGEPEEVLPYLERAAKGGLVRPPLFASLAREEYESNQFEAAYQSATRALNGDSRGRSTWEIYARAACALQHFDTVLKRLDQAFPKDTPLWAETIRKNTAGLLAGWQSEQRLRQSEAKMGNLPEVRLIIEHRRFAHTADGTATSKEEAAGRGEVDLELFEDQAPKTVADFLHLVESGFYNGTRFHLVEPGGVAAGGDPNTKNADPADDGSGGPGYTIPDEQSLRGARRHFRGSIAMINTGPHTAGSQFFIDLVPHPEFNGYFTVFGRVVRGQEVLDRMTPGRTNTSIGRFGKIIPGDVLVRATVVRKRSHPYVVSKNPR